MPHTTTRDSCRIFYEASRLSDDRPTVVLLNGMTQSTAHWNKHVDALEAFGVVTYDARGQGQSDLGDSEITLDRHADDLAMVLDELSVETAHLVGFSHGARVALGFARHHGGRLDRLVLCSATSSPNALARTIVRGWRGVLEHGDLSGLAWASLPMILGNDFLESHENILEGIVRATVQRNSEEGVRALLEAMEHYPTVTELAADVDTPTLVMSATEDPLVTREGARELADLTGGDHVEIDGVGHTVPIEAPEEFRAHVKRFING